MYLRVYKKTNRYLTTSLVHCKQILNVLLRFLVFKIINLMTNDSYIIYIIDKFFYSLKS